MIENKINELNEEIDQLLGQINNVIKSNIKLLRELNQLTSEEETFNLNLNEVTEQLSALAVKFDISLKEETKSVIEINDTSENEEL